MYSFPYLWTNKLKIDFLQRVVLIHSYLYYILDNPTWSDKKYDCVCMQLVKEQSKHSEQWITDNTQYGYVFYDFDGSTGFNLWYNLVEPHKRQIGGITKAYYER